MNAGQTITINIIHGHEESKCLRCHKVLDQDEEAHIICIFNFEQLAYPFCAECADDYNEAYCNMLVKFIEEQPKEICNATPNAK